MRFVAVVFASAVLSFCDVGASLLTKRGENDADIGWGDLAAYAVGSVAQSVASGLRGERYNPYAPSYPPYPYPPPRRAQRYAYPEDEEFEASDDYDYDY
jgi:hypothetical protein